MENATEQLQEIDGRIGKNWSEIVVMEGRLLEAGGQLTELKGQADALNQSLSELQQIIISSKDQIASINSHYADYFAKVDPSVKTKLETVTEHYASAEQFLRAATDIKKQLEDFRDFVYGNETLGTLGFKKDIETLLENNRTANENLNKEWAGVYNTLYQKIEGLLPGATATGLSKAYQDQKTNYKLPVIIWSIVFGVTVLGMMVFGIWVYSEITDLSDSLRHIIARLPFFIPAIWLAIFAAKQQSKYMRLQQEYIYKETLAKSYEAYKREIDKLPPGDEKNILHQKLIESMVEMCGFNPSLTLEHKSHAEKPPIPGNGIWNRLFGKSKSEAEIKE